MSAKHNADRIVAVNNSHSTGVSDHIINITIGGVSVVGSGGNRNNLSRGILAVEQQCVGAVCVLSKGSTVSCGQSNRTVACYIDLNACGLSVIIYIVVICVVCVPNGGKGNGSTFRRLVPSNKDSIILVYCGRFCIALTIQDICLGSESTIGFLDLNGPVRVCIGAVHQLIVIGVCQPLCSDGNIAYNFILTGNLNIANIPTVHDYAVSLVANSQQIRNGDNCVHIIGLDCRCGMVFGRIGNGIGFNPMSFDGSIGGYGILGTCFNLILTYIPSVKAIAGTSGLGRNGESFTTLNRCGGVLTITPCIIDGNLIYCGLGEHGSNGYISGYRRQVSAQNNVRTVVDFPTLEVEIRRSCFIVSQIIVGYLSAVIQSFGTGHTFDDPGNSVASQFFGKRCSIGSITGNFGDGSPCAVGKVILRSRSLRSSGSNRIFTVLVGFGGGLVTVLPSNGITSQFLGKGRSIGNVTGNLRDRTPCTIGEMILSGRSLRSHRCFGSCTILVFFSSSFITIYPSDSILFYYSFVSCSISDFGSNGINRGIPALKGVTGDDISVCIFLIRFSSSRNFNFIRSCTVGILFLGQNSTVIIFEGNLMSLDYPLEFTAEIAGGFQPGLAGICNGITYSVCIQLTLNRSQGNGQTSISLNVCARLIRNTNCI